MGDEIACLNPGRIRGGVVNGGHHFDKAFFLRHLNAQTAKFAAGLRAHVGGIIW